MNLVKGSEPMTGRRLQTELLLHAGRLLLEYNESTEAIHRALMTTARALTDDACQIMVSYRGITVSLAGEGAALETVTELHYNMAVHARIHEILDQVRRGEVDASTALNSLSGLESEPPRHSGWLSAVVLGAAAASLARLLGADAGAMAVAGLATSLGLLVRRELGRHHFSLLALPLAAAFIGAVMGGLAIHFAWTDSPELVLIVPALMVIPGPHIINGLLDLIDNHVPMSIFRLALASGILLAAALGIILGVELVHSEPLSPERSVPGQLSLTADALLAGMATCGFAVFYNTQWRLICMATVGGMAGHGLRYLALKVGWQLEAASFLGGLMVGAFSAWMASSSKTPVAIIAFAGAVTMIPGLSLYRALGGAWQLARLPDAATAAAVADTVASALQACLVVSGLALGVILGSRTALSVFQIKAAGNS
jgi:uncharacterized membrane protein YjjP (DUF1212 family)